jgi:hypothetical protein
MSEAPPALFRKRRLQAFRGRGELYSWLRAHREKIAEGLSSGEYTWAMLCAECCRHGVASRSGGAPDRTAAWKAWQTLCRDLETLGETPIAKTPRPKPPSRFPKDWKPEAFRSGAPAPPSQAAAAGNPEPYDPKKRMAQLRRTINERSGRKDDTWTE